VRKKQNADEKRNDDKQKVENRRTAKPRETATPHNTAHVAGTRLPLFFLQVPSRYRKRQTLLASRKQQKKPLNPKK